MGIPASRKTRRTPRWAIPRAKPPARAKPTRGRSLGSPCSPYAKERRLSFALRNQPGDPAVLFSSVIPLVEPYRLGSARRLIRAFRVCHLSLLTELVLQLRQTACHAP